MTASKKNIHAETNIILMNIGALPSSRFFARTAPIIDENRSMRKMISKKFATSELKRIP